MALMKQEQKSEASGDLIQALKTEKDSLDESFEHARRLLSEAIENEKGGKKNGHGVEDDLVNVVPSQPARVSCRVRVPEKEHPKYNFVGKLLGPKGSTLKQLQLDTGTRMSILGRNSIRDKAKEEEQRNTGGPKYSHLHKDLHVLIEAFCPAAEAYSRIGHALTEMKKYFTPDPNDDIRQNQMMEMGMGAPAPRGGGGGMGRGRGRGGPSRGMARPFGSTRGRPVPGSRGTGRGGPRGRGAPAGRGRVAPRPLSYPVEEEYYDDGYGETYGDEGTYEDSYTEGAADEGSYGYSDGGAGDGYQSYDYGGYGGSTQSGGYGAQSGSSSGSYGGYSSGGSGWSSGAAGSGRQSMKTPTQYTQKPASRPHPYTR
ncbi:KH domain-containing, RNA-binding, signal transduction-associated protein 2-like isoform X2 [Apostichopus japonicus]